MYVIDHAGTIKVSNFGLKPVFWPKNIKIAYKFKPRIVDDRAKLRCVACDKPSNLRFGKCAGVGWINMNPNQEGARRAENALVGCQIELSISNIDLGTSSLIGSKFCSNQLLTSPINCQLF